MNACVRDVFMPAVKMISVFTFSQWGRNHCVMGKLASARVYSKVDYVFGSVLPTITEMLFSLCRKSASINPIEMKKRLYFFLSGAG